MNLWLWWWNREKEYVSNAYENVILNLVTSNGLNWLHQTVLMINQSKKPSYLCSYVSQVRWWSFNQNCKIHENDYHGIVVHTLGGHNSLCLKSYKFKIKKIKQMKKFKIFFHYKKRKILKQNTTICLLSLLRYSSQLKVLSITPGAITNVFLFVLDFSTFYWQEVQFFEIFLIFLIYNL